MAGGAVGMVAALAVAVLGWVLIGSTREALLDSLEVTTGALELAADTIATVDSAFSDVSAALDTTEEALGDASEALSTIGVVTQEVSVLLGDEIPSQVESVLDAFPPLVDTARVVDRTMRALTIVGVDYDPEQPLDETLEEIASSLEPLPDRLRGQQGNLADAADELVVLAVSLEELSGDVAALRGRLDDTASLVEGYEQAAAQATGVVARLRDDLAWQTGLARLAAVAMAVALGVASSVPLVAGRLSLARGQEGASAP